MGWTNATRETAALAITALGDRISLHTADPGTTGASEATGGSPAYARQQTTWSAGGSDGLVTGSQVSFNLPAGTYTHIGLWSSGGTFIGGKAIASGSVLLSAQGVLPVVPTVNVPA